MCIGLVDTAVPVAIPRGVGGRGGAGDTGNNAQNVNSLLGKMLRIDVNGDDFPGSTLQDYAIPPDNPRLRSRPCWSAPTTIW